MPQSQSHRAILINAKTGVISDIVIKDYTDITKYLDCRCFTAVRLADDEVLYVDDEGLINGTQHGFTIDYGNGGLMGNGLILGNTFSGDSADSKLAIADLAEKFGIKEAFINDEGTFFHKTLVPASELN